MFSRYYQSELSYLRETGREFARANPSLADAFAERGGDPDVERLLEGFAFLTARIRERAEDAVPELVDSLAQVLLPHYQRPLPAATVVELTPKPGQLRNRHRVPAGTPLGTEPAEGTSCVFRTTEDLEVVPASIERVQLDERTTGRPEIRVHLRVPEHGRAAVFHPGGLRLFLGGSWPQASTLALWIARHLDEVRVRSGGALDVRLPDGAVQPHGGGEAAGLWPWPELAPDAPRRLQEYFTLPSSHLFFDVFGLERVDPGPIDEHIELAFRFAAPPALPERFAEAAIRMHCVPAVNLFDTTAEPIARDPLRREYLVRAAGAGRNEAEVFEVHSVTGLRPQRRGRVDYRPLYAPGMDQPSGSAAGQYTLRRACSPIDGALDTYVAVQDGFHEADRRNDAREAGPGEETLSLEMTCTNRLLPASLRIGDVCRALPASPSIATFRNVTGVSKPVSPPVGSELQWRLLRHLALTHRSLGDAGSLRALVDLYNFQRGVDAQVGRSNERRVESIRAVEMRPTTRVLRGAALQGVHTTVEVEEAAFAGPGDVHLFGSALDVLFAAQLPINTFNSLTVRLHPSLGELQWMPRTGTQRIL